MDAARTLQRFSHKAGKRIQAAVDREGLSLCDEFQQVVANFIDELNGRYQRHCFVFTDSMGCKSIELWHRVTGKRLCWWSTDNGRFDERSSLFDVYSSLDGTSLDEEITSFMKVMGEFEGALNAGTYFLWDGKSHFSAGDDGYKRGLAA